MQRAHARPLGIEGKLGQARQRCLPFRPAESGGLRGFEQRRLGGIAAQFSVGVGDGIVAQHHRHAQFAPGRIFRLPQPRPGLARGLHAVDLHPVQGERAGLVGTDIGNRAERFHCGQTADQHVLPDHARRPQGERDGDHRRQRFGNRSDGQADRGEQQRHQRFAAQPAGHEEDRAKRQHRQRQMLAEARQPLLQRRLAGFAGQQRGDFPQFGLHAGGHHQAARAAVADDRSLVGHVEAVAQRQGGFFQPRHPFLGRLRFAGQRGFIHLERRQFQQAQVGRHHVAGFEQDDIARHQLDRRDFPDRAIADHGSRRGGHPFQCRHGALGAILLDESHDAVEQHDDHDGDAILRLADKAGDDGGGDQHQDHEIGELRCQHGKRMAPAGHLHGVGTILRQSGRSRLRRHARLRVAAQAGDGIFAAQTVPVRPGIAGITRHDANTQRGIRRRQGVAMTQSCMMSPAASRPLRGYSRIRHIHRCDDAHAGSRNGAS